MSPICNGSSTTWGGTTCIDGVITSIFLLTIKLVGTIPSSIGSLSRLTSLDLHSNSITGTLPSTLGQLSKIVSIRVDSNSLTGIVPSTLCAATSLTSLNFGNNLLACYAPCLKSVAILTTGAISTLCTSGASYIRIQFNHTNSHLLAPTLVPTVQPSGNTVPECILHICLNTFFLYLAPTNIPTVFPTTPRPTSGSVRAQFVSNFK